ncbi:MAG: DNA polymerase III subunit delta' [Gammaproteobacteria bacterium]|nr:DNA polymerase III subunit delta' [Gammaproteobacteria bacterium]
MTTERKTEPLRELPRLYPWQRQAWDRLQRAFTGGRLPHALLITGAGGIGKRRFADALANSLLCRSRDQGGLACGHCRGCELLLAGSHPDLKWIEPEEPGKAIRIDSIREYVAGGALTAQAGGYKIVIIDPAEQMNTAAANSLLKTLEEPVDWTLIVLISSRIDTLPATIRSRCQQFPLPQPDPKLAEHWLRERTESSDPRLLLALAAGAPLRALALAEPERLVLRVKLLEQFAAIVDGSQDPVAVAAAWCKLDPGQLLNWYSGWLTDCLRLRSDPGYPDLFNPDQRERLQLIADKIESKRLFGLLDGVNRAIGAQESQLNDQMLLESLLLSLDGGSGVSG